MPSSHRRTPVFTGLLLALSLIGTPLLAQPRRTYQPGVQRGGAPNQDTPQILIAAFAGPSPSRLGVEVADEVRNRIQDEHSAKELFVVTKTNIETALKQYGYSPDSALSATDLLELARVTHGDYVLLGKVVKNGPGLRADLRIVTRTERTPLAQPLPPVDGKDPEDVAKYVERYVTDALKQMTPYRACINDLREQKFDQAVKDGALAIAAYPNSTLARTCQLQAFSNLNQVDSVIATAQALLARDSSSAQALSNLIDAWQKKGDNDKVIQYSMLLWSRDPANETIVRNLIDLVARSGSAEKALPMIDTLLVLNPADTGMLRRKWVVLLSVGRYEPALAAGEEWVKVDTAAANVDWFNRQIGAAQKDSNATKVLELAKRGSTKFPKDVSFTNVYASQALKAHSPQQALEAAKRAMMLDPKSTDAVVLAIAAAKELNLTDSIAALASRGIAGGADKATLQPFLYGPLGVLLNKAQTSRERGDWEAALEAAQKMDASAPAPTTKFIVGFSAFNIGLDALQNAKRLGEDANPKTGKDSRAKACAEAKVTEDMWLIAQTNVPVGAAISRDGATQAMQVIQQYIDVVPQMKKAYCTGK